MVETKTEQWVSDGFWFKFLSKPGKNLATNKKTTHE